MAGCETYRSGKHDSIIAIGGGSAMDGAKAIGMTVNSGEIFGILNIESHHQK